VASSKLEDAAKDGIFLGYTIKRAGIVGVMVVQAIAILSLSATLILVQINTAKLAPKLADRWTATDQAQYVKEHDTGVDELVETKMGEINGTFADVTDAVQDMRETLAADHERLKNIERSLERIEKKVFNGGYQK
jgi:septation ring formation regulator EzrA